MLPFWSNVGERVEYEIALVHQFVWECECRGVDDLIVVINYVDVDYAVVLGSCGFVCAA